MDVCEMKAVHLAQHFDRSHVKLGTGTADDPIFPMDTPAMYGPVLTPALAWG